SRRREKLGLLRSKSFCAESQALRFAAGAKRQPVLKNIPRFTPCPLGLRDGFLNGIRIALLGLKSGTDVPFQYIDY
ncbi:MAG: hypothetical protein HY456_01145, partial [Parcubacteria group bacterium]|nr:hypothetical protein [Parcubacteria group bacterium]